MPRHSTEPTDREGYRRRFDRFYTRTAPIYDRVVKAVRIWRRWLSSALPHLKGPRVLEVSFGTGWLLTRYAGRFEVHGIDLNERMVEIARRNVQRAGLSADLRLDDVEDLPFPDASFDTVLCTMAFSGYPDGHAALSEMVRVLEPTGRIVLIDVGHPSDGNRLGTWMIRTWALTGDLIRDMGTLFREFGLEVTHDESGGWSSVHLWIATRPRTAAH